MFSISSRSKSTSILETKQVEDYLRYLIWLGLAGTANANRRHYGLATTWVPHLLGNSLALLLPEIYRLIDGRFHFKKRIRAEHYPTGAALLATFEQLVQDNPAYLDYVAPAALAYIVSHPRFNIYRGRWARLNVLGFGLDSIPHGTTAYALSTLAYDGLAGLERNMPVRPWAGWLAAHKTLATGGFLALLTFIYEFAEYRIHQSELKARHNDLSQINMMWSPRDTLFDVLSNLIGWAVAVWRCSRSKR